MQGLVMQSANLLRKQLFIIKIFFRKKIMCVKNIAFTFKITIFPTKGKYSY